MPLKGPGLPCTVPGCPEACTVGADELTLGMPQLCDTHFYEPVMA